MEVCHDYLNGNCRLEDKCKYSHVAATSAAPVSTPSFFAAPTPAVSHKFTTSLPNPSSLSTAASSTVNGAAANLSVDLFSRFTTQCMEASKKASAALPSNSAAGAAAASRASTVANARSCLGNNVSDAPIEPLSVIPWSHPPKASNVKSAPTRSTAAQGSLFALPPPKTAPAGLFASQPGEILESSSSTLFSEVSPPKFPNLKLATSVPRLSGLFVTSEEREINRLKTQVAFLQAKSGTSGSGSLDDKCKTLEKEVSALLDKEKTLTGQLALRDRLIELLREDVQSASEQKTLLVDQVALHEQQRAGRAKLTQMCDQIQKILLLYKSLAQDLRRFSPQVLDISKYLDTLEPNSDGLLDYFISLTDTLREIGITVQKEVETAPFLKHEGDSTISSQPPATSGQPPTFGSGGARVVSKPYPFAFSK